MSFRTCFLASVALVPCAAILAPTDANAQLFRFRKNTSSSANFDPCYVCPPENIEHDACRGACEESNCRLVYIDGTYYPDPNATEKCPANCYCPLINTSFDPNLVACRQIPAGQPGLLSLDDPSRKDMFVTFYTIDDIVEGRIVISKQAFPPNKDDFKYQSCKSGLQKNPKWIINVEKNTGHNKTIPDPRYRTVTVGEGQIVEASIALQIDDQHKEYVYEFNKANNYLEVTYNKWIFKITYDPKGQ
ncbi:MAG: hypothetical protein ABL888_01795 [Pirellulaceae bacterium]